MPPIKHVVRCGRNPPKRRQPLLHAEDANPDVVHCPPHMAPPSKATQERPMNARWRLWPARSFLTRRNSRGTMKFEEYADAFEHVVMRRKDGILEFRVHTDGGP